MKFYLAVTLVVASLSPVAAFAPSSHLLGAHLLTPGSTSTIQLLEQESTAATSTYPALSTRLWSSFLGMQDDEDEDEDDDDEDEADLVSSGSSVTSPFTGMKLDPWDPNPLIKPRPSRIFRDTPTNLIPDDQLEQAMSADERQENLNIMRRLQKNDLPDLRRRKDHAGWVEANNDLKRRKKKDPWFAVNERIRDAVQLGEDADKIDELKALAQRLGGPPPGIDINPGKGYAVHTEIYDIPLSPNRAASYMERQIREERAARGRAMMAERRKNQEQAQQQFEEDMRNPGVREDREARERRERTMRRLLQELEEDKKKQRDRAKELLGKLPETPESRTKAMEQALQEARDEVKRIRRQRLGQGADAVGGVSDNDEDDDDASTLKSTGAADKARAQAAAEASGGRPRLPGDDDVTQGELDPTLTVESASSTTTGPLTVEVSSSYNKDQSDPPMRKHCFQYTIRITNNSKDTIQLLGRRFEIQTVGSSMKDVVQGEGVTGRTPVLKPGEVFEYTSSAPLSVRPLGTTIIAARMQGEYRYVLLEEGQETASAAQSQDDSAQGKAALGTFHFIFPEDQRVKPFRSAEETDDEEEEEEEDEVEEKPPAVAAAKSASSSTVKPASSLPGDKDMTSGDISVSLNDSSETVTDDVRVMVTSSYRPERSDEAMDKHCFAYNIRIANESKGPIQLVSRRFEIQTVGSETKDVVQGPGVTGRQPILKPGESFEYTSTAPLSVKPMLNKTPVVARMQGVYNFVKLAEDGTTPLSSTPLQAKLAVFHFILPAIA